MHRAVLTLLVGLMLSLAGGASAFANSDVIWEGTQESKVFSLTGPKKIRITTEGVFINGKFKPAWRLSKDGLACTASLIFQTRFPTHQRVGTLLSRNLISLPVNQSDYKAVTTSNLYLIQRRKLTAISRPLETITFRQLTTILCVEWQPTRREGCVLGSNAQRLATQQSHMLRKPSAGD